MVADTLLDLYRASSKHSQYQALPSRVRPLLPPGSISYKSRHERERLSYLCGKLDFRDLSIADIGGNTGYFSFELLDRGAGTVDYYEGNFEHSTFVARAADLVGLGDRLRVHPVYLDFAAATLPVHDVALLLNVLHHIGDDYGDSGTALEQVQETIRVSLTGMAHCARRLVFQLGFNWQGNPKHPIFANGTRAEVIDLVAGLSDSWDIEAVGIAGQVGSEIIYQDLNPSNLARDDRLGEFLNRPLFILQSRFLASA